MPKLSNVILYLTVLNLIWALLINAYPFDFEENRITVGTLTKIDKFPYIVIIKYKNRLLCGGSYILPYWILTTAHCLVANRRRVLTCVMGQTYLNYADRNTQTRNSVAVYPHERFNSNNMALNIGLIRIDVAFAFTDKVASVNLVDYYYPVNTKWCEVAGWGLTDREIFTYKSKLQLRYIKVPIIAQKRCGEIYYLDMYQRYFKDAKIFCAGQDGVGHDACLGDSGSPLVCDNVQVGIMSWEIACGNELPAVYTNVTTFRSWIMNVVGTPENRGFQQVEEGADLQRYPENINTSISRAALSYCRFREGALILIFYLLYLLNS